MLLYHASHLCRFMSRFISLSGLSTFSAFKNIQKTKNLSFFCCSTCTIFVYFFSSTATNSSGRMIFSILMASANSGAISSSV